MILWFKDSSRSPIYSYDVRNENEAPRHLPLKNELGLRLHFRIFSKYSSSNGTPRPPALFIRNVQKSDEGIYRCRIDYKNSPTANAIIKLNVILPPTHLEIQDTSQLRLFSDQEANRNSKKIINSQNDEEGSNEISYMGPYIEGQNISLVCTAFGGIPLPEVIWYRNGLLHDWSYETYQNEAQKNSQNFVVVTNELKILKLAKNHSLDLYSCEASNNNETKPISTRLNLDVYTRVKHIEVEIPNELTAGFVYNLSCRTEGAYPSVKMEFWKLQKRVGQRYQIRSDVGDEIVYNLSFVPEPSDNEELLTCKAENPWIPQNFMESGRKLNVVYSPIVVLRFGSTKRENFSEGESVLLECHVKANPSVESIAWFHRGRQLFESLNGVVQINGNTLVLRHLTHLSGGFYACEATNSVGRGISNKLNIQLNISPKCADFMKTIPLSVGESQNLSCNLIASPSNLNFYWTFNQSSSPSQIFLPTASQKIASNLTQQELLSKEVELNFKKSAGIFSDSEESKQVLNITQILINKRKNSEEERNFHQSILNYRVESKIDYGLVACWASNSIGKQIYPCLFQIIPSRAEYEEPVPASVSPSISHGVKLNEEKESDFTSWFYPTNNNNEKTGDTTSLSSFGSYNNIFLLLFVFMSFFCLTGLTFWLVRRKKRKNSNRAQDSASSSISPKNKTEESSVNRATIYKTSESQTSNFKEEQREALTIS